MKSFTFRLSRFIRKIGVLINTPPPRPARISAHCTNINMLLMHLCDFDRERYCYILKWLAYPLRHPGAKMRYGLVIQGEEGTGLNLFFRHVAVLLHQGRGRIIHTSALNDPVNHTWAGAPLLVADGRITSHSMAHVKELMTSPSIVVGRKDQPARWAPNRMNFIFLTADINPLRQAGADRRRFVVLEAPPKRERTFYQAIEGEIKNGGVDAFRSFLLRGIDMAGFNETTVPPGFERADPSEVRGASLHLVKEPA